MLDAGHDVECTAVSPQQNTAGTSGLCTTSCCTLNRHSIAAETGCSLTVLSEDFSVALTCVLRVLWCLYSESLNLQCSLLSPGNILALRGRIGDQDKRSSNILVQEGVHQLACSFACGLAL